MQFTTEELERLKQGIGDAIFIIPFADSMGYPYKQKTQSSREILVEFYKRLGGFGKTVAEKAEEQPFKATPTDDTPVIGDVFINVHLVFNIPKNVTGWGFDIQGLNQRGLSSSSGYLSQKWDSFGLIPFSSYQDALEAGIEYYLTKIQPLESAVADSAAPPHPEEVVTPVEVKG